MDNWNLIFELEVLEMSNMVKKFLIMRIFGSKLIIKSLVKRENMLELRRLLAHLDSKYPFVEKFSIFF